MHIEAAKLLQFSEEEFVKALDWGTWTSLTERKDKSSIDMFFKVEHFFDFALWMNTSNICSR